jgi:hypothetical protein
MMDIFEERKEIGVAVAEDGFVTALEEMTDGTVSPVEVHRVALVDALKDPGQRDIPCFNQQMDMIVHEDIGIQMVGVTIFIDGQESEIPLKVGRIFKYLLSLVTSRDDMVEGPIKLYPRFPWHGWSLAEESNTVNMEIFKSDPIRSHTVPKNTGPANYPRGGVDK